MCLPPKVFCDDDTQHFELIYSFDGFIPYKDEWDGRLLPGKVHYQVLGLCAVSLTVFSVVHFAAASTEDCSCAFAAGSNTTFPYRCNGDSIILQVIQGTAADNCLLYTSDAADE